MRPQFGRIREVVQAFGIPIYEKDGFEADDVLGTLSAQATQQGVESIIYTGDMDNLQLVNKHVTVKVAKRGITEITEYDEDAVKARYGLTPEKLPDFKALVGDKSDNIPGVPGIGEKTASKLIADYGSLEGVLAHLDKLTPRLRASLEEHRGQVFANRELARIVTEVPVTLDLERARRRSYDRERVVELFRELEFRSLVARLPPLEGPRVSAAPMQPQLGLEVPPQVPTELAAGTLVADGDVAQVAERLAAAGEVGLQVEVRAGGRPPPPGGAGL